MKNQILLLFILIPFLGTSQEGLPTFMKGYFHSIKNHEYRKLAKTTYGNGGLQGEGLDRVADDLKATMQGATFSSFNYEVISTAKIGKRSFAAMRVQFHMSSPWGGQMNNIKLAAIKERGKWYLADAEQCVFSLYNIMPASINNIMASSIY